MTIEGKNRKAAPIYFSFIYRGARELKKGRRCPYCRKNLHWDPYQQQWYCQEHGTIPVEILKLIK
jgi:hypothetical protein